MLVLSNKPGMDPQAFININLIALPIVAFALFPGPNKLSFEFMPISLEMGPLTTTKIPAPPWLEDGPIRLNSGVSIASVAATTTGKYSGRQPAMTAFAAVFKIEICLRLSGTSPKISVGLRLTKSINS